jgi:hypothetical protein
LTRQRGQEFIERIKRSGTEACPAPLRQRRALQQRHHGLIIARLVQR